MSLLSRMNKKPEAGSTVDVGMSPRDLATFQAILYEKSGIVLADNKRALVESRVNQRLRILGLNTFGAYLDMLQKDASGEELVLLIDVISTNVTQFFREPDHFELMHEVVSKWAESGVKRMRFWSAACSTGQEPYTMAMTLHPIMRKYGLDLKILATDISTRVLAHAKQGHYEPALLKGVPDNLRKTYFARQKVDGQEVEAVSAQLKDMVMFRRLNFTVFPYPINGIFDMILCRNAMIYFDRTLRGKMVPEFARLLKPEGYLLIGHAETLIGIEGGLRTIKPAVYQRLNDGEVS